MEILKSLFTTGHVFTRFQAQHNINILLQHGVFFVFSFFSIFANTSKQTIHSYFDDLFVCMMTQYIICNIYIA